MEWKAKRGVFVYHILHHFPTQLTNPQKKSRKSLCQFGYNLSLFSIPLFPITSFINPAKFGKHSYGKPGIQEHNGSLYTCKGGFMDFSHIRCAADWAVYLTFKILTENADFDLPNEAGSLQLHFHDLEKLSLEEVSSLAQKIAFERLVWHEVASWHYHRPNFTSNEQQSTFSPEDLYSDLLGTEIGKSIALRILKNLDTLSYSQIANEEIEKKIATLQPFTTKKQSARAYDRVDRNKQLKLPSEKRNANVWYDSEIIFGDERYVFKRNLSIGPSVEPWLVPASNNLGCVLPIEKEVLEVPQQTSTNVSYNNYYTFTINPEAILFYKKKTKQELHTPFASFTTAHLAEIINVVRKEMEQKLSTGFDQQNSQDPVPSFKHLTKVWFR